MICPNCGSNNPDGTAFCANCGSPVSNGAPNNGAIPPQAQPNFQGSAPNGGMTPPPVFNGNPFPGGHIEQRNIALCIILSIITCGIYGLYWIYKLTEDVNTLKGDPNATSGGIVILLGIITCGIRFLGTMAEGVSFSILLMNLLTPYIDKLTMTHPFGAKPAVKKEAK